MDVLVAGGDGFVGRHLCAELVERGHAVTSLSRSPDPEVLPEAVETTTGDVTDPTFSMVPRTDTKLFTAGYLCLIVPTCKHCESFVTEQYVRVFAPTDMETVRVCPNCEDIIRDGPDVRETRSNRS